MTSNFMRRIRHLFSTLYADKNMEPTYELVTDGRFWAIKRTTIVNKFMRSPIEKMDFFSQGGFWLSKDDRDFYLCWMEKNRAKQWLNRLSA